MYRLEVLAAPAAAVLKLRAEEEARRYRIRRSDRSPKRGRKEISIFDLGIIWFRPSRNGRSSLSPMSAATLDRHISRSHWLGPIARWPRPRTVNLSRSHSCYRKQTNYGELIN